MDTYLFAQLSRGICIIDTLEKKVVTCVSVVQQQQQLSIEIVTNLSIKHSVHTRYYRKSAVVSKQKARTRSRHILLSSKVFIQTIAQGVRQRYVVNRVYFFKQQVSIETVANVLNYQQISIDTLANLFSWAIGIDR